jgi:hypothetical protein
MSNFIKITRPCYIYDLGIDIQAGEICRFIKTQKCNSAHSGLWIHVYLPKKYNYQKTRFCSSLTDYSNDSLKSTLKYLL